jgi:hypothetical protein
MVQGGAKASSSLALTGRHYEAKTSGLLGIFHHAMPSKTFDPLPIGARRSVRLKAGRRTS